MPVTRKATKKGRDEEREKAVDEETFYTFFIYRARWFVLSQTEGDDLEPEPIPGWEKDQALRELGITEELFEAANGNMQGYSAPGRKIAINPLAQLPHKTLFRELAHQVLGHWETRPSSSANACPGTFGKRRRNPWHSYAARPSTSRARPTAAATSNRGSPVTRSRRHRPDGSSRPPKRSSVRARCAIVRNLRSPRGAPDFAAFGPPGYRTSAFGRR